MPKAIIEIAQADAYIAAARTTARRVDAGERVPEADYHLGFATAALLFAEITPERMGLLESLKRSGPRSIDALAGQLGRDTAKVHSDVNKLMAHGLIEQDATGRVFVPWEEIQLQVTFAADCAA